MLTWLGIIAFGLEGIYDLIMIVVIDCERYVVMNVKYSAGYILSMFIPI